MSSEPSEEVSSEPSAEVSTEPSKKLVANPQKKPVQSHLKRSVQNLVRIVVAQQETDFGVTSFENDGDIVKLEPDEGEVLVDLTDVNGDSNTDQEFMVMSIRAMN